MDGIVHGLRTVVVVTLFGWLDVCMFVSLYLFLCETICFLWVFFIFLETGKGAHAMHAHP